MPVILPTPEEAARLSSVKRYRIEHLERVARQRAKEAVRALALALDDEMAKDRTWLPFWAELVRDDARALLAAMPADPRADEHRAEVVA